jgi:hypothetical protein
MGEVGIGMCFKDTEMGKPPKNMLFPIINSEGFWGLPDSRSLIHWIWMFADDGSFITSIQLHLGLD